MNKVFHFPKLLLICCLLFLGLLLPLPKVKAASIVPVITNENKADVKLNVKKKNLVKDTSYTLILYNLSNKQTVSFKSSDSDIAYVNQEGVVSAKKVGEAEITVTVKEGNKTVATLTCDITVGPPAISIMFNTGESSEITLTVDHSTLLDTILKPNNTVEDVKFYSSNLNVATVSSNGRITAKGPGKCYVFGEISNGQFAKIAVIVEEEKKSDKK